MYIYICLFKAVESLVKLVKASFRTVLGSASGLGLVGRHRCERLRKRDGPNTVNDRSDMCITCLFNLLHT